jgi:hypothetical protein
MQFEGQNCRLCIRMPAAWRIREKVGVGSALAACSWGHCRVHHTLCHLHACHPFCHEYAACDQSVPVIRITFGFVVITSNVKTVLL